MVDEMSLEDENEFYNDGFADGMINGKLEGHAAGKREGYEQGLLTALGVIHHDNGYCSQAIEEIEKLLAELD